MQALPKRNHILKKHATFIITDKLKKPHNQKTFYAKDWLKEKISGFYCCKRYTQKDWTNSLVLNKKTVALLPNDQFHQYRCSHVTHEVKFHHNLSETIWRHVDLVKLYLFQNFSRKRQQPKLVGKNIAPGRLKKNKKAFLFLTNIMVAYISIYDVFIKSNRNICEE